jgi:hypothetical protein
MTLARRLVLATILVLTTALGFELLTESVIARNDAIVVAAKVEGEKAPTLNARPWTQPRYQQSRSFTVASACTQACQRKQNACYRDCEVRYAESTAADDCKGACDADKRLCRKACQ